MKILIIFNKNLLNENLHNNKLHNSLETQVHFLEISLKYYNGFILEIIT